MTANYSNFCLDRVEEYVKNQNNLICMQRSQLLLEKRKQFIKNYVENNSDRQMKVIVEELIERLFISERTIYNILKD